MIEDKLINNIKVLQDLKFEIYSRSSNLDFHSFNLYTLQVDDEVIDLTKWIGEFKVNQPLSEIAEMIVQEYQL